MDRLVRLGRADFMSGPFVALVAVAQKRFNNQEQNGKHIHQVRIHKQLINKQTIVLLIRFFFYFINRAPISCKHFE